MSRSWKSRAAVLAFAATMAVPVIGFASPAGAAGAGKFAINGPPFAQDCDGSSGFSTPGDFGFAVINAPDGNVQATVSLKKQQPNTTFNVLLIQGNADCFTVDATLTTNGQGNGTVHLSEPSVSTHAFVGLLGGAIGGYVTDVYNH